MENLPKDNTCGIIQFLAAEGYQSMEISAEIKAVYGQRNDYIRWNILKSFIASKRLSVE